VNVTSEEVSLNKTIQVVVGNMETNIGLVADTEDALTPRKIIHQGQVYILRADTVYTILGNPVSVIK
jgi:tRNA A37 threonylcarbamoyladenosine synthetase subunit TsaC/SUA5/YrdC